MALDFPNPAAQTPVNEFSPTSTPSATTNGVTYTWDGTKWVGAAGGGSGVTPDLQGVTDEGNTTTNDIITSGDVQATSFNGGQLGFRNVVINGDFRVWQRGEGPMTIPTGGALSFLADRFYPRAAFYTGGTTTQQLFVDNGVNKYRFTASGATSLGFLSQQIEAQNCRHLAGNQVTLSCYGSHQPGFNLVYYDGSDVAAGDTLPGVLVPGETNRWSATFTIPSGQIASSGTLVGMVFQIRYNNAQSPLADGTYDIWNVQLEPGPVATPFEDRPIGTELALCQRYYQTLYINNSTTITSTGSQTSRWDYQFPVQMRAAPTYTTTSSGLSNQGNTVQVTTATQNFIRIQADPSQPEGWLRYSYNVLADAEL